MPKTSHGNSFGMNFSEHINGLDSIIKFNCRKNKQDNLYTNHKFTLNITEQKNHHYGYILYEPPKFYIIKLLWVVGVQLICGVGI